MHGGESNGLAMLRRWRHGDNVEAAARLVLAIVIDVAAVVALLSAVVVVLVVVASVAATPETTPAVSKFKKIACKA